MARVTVCIPTYESKPEHLRAAIGSVLAQTFSDWELCIHDDCSKTDVKAIVEPFLQDPRVKFRRSPERLGIGGNWNAAAAMGNGEYVAYIFQDDLWDTRFLERGVRVFEEFPDVGFVAMQHRYLMEGTTGAAATGIYDEVMRKRAETFMEGVIRREHFLNHWIGMGLRPNLIGEPSFVMLRRSLMQEVGPFHPTMRQGLDADYWVRCLVKADGYWIADSMGEFRVHAAAATAQNEEHGVGLTDRLQVFRKLIKILPAGHTKSHAKKILRRELLGMAKKAMTRKTQNAHLQFLRYFIVGGSSSVLDFATYAILSTVIGVNYFAAAFAGYTLGFVMNHSLCVLWVFESKMERKKEVALSYAIAIGGLLWTEVLLWLAVDVFGIGLLIARLGAMVIVLAWNFFMRKFFVFA
jgi:glycosyltransferase involved in cell wall biosynthesis